LFVGRHVARAKADAPQLNTGDLIIPQSDAKDFYDAQVDCKVNAVKSASCQETVANLKQVSAVKDEEIKQLNVAIKGGTKWKRFASAAKWVGVGAGLGAVAVLAHR
jgi:hypothetical protein